MFEAFVVYTKKGNADFAVSKEVGVITLASPSSAHRGFEHCIDGNRFVVDTIAQNFRHEAKGVSTYVLERETQRRDTYTQERLVASILHANDGLRDRQLARNGQADFSVSIAAVLATENAVSIVQAGHDVSVHRVRSGEIKLLTVHELGLPNLTELSPSLNALHGQRNLTVSAHQYAVLPNDIFVVEEIGTPYKPSAALTRVRELSDNIGNALVACFAEFGGPTMLLGRWS